VGETIDRLFDKYGKRKRNEGKSLAKMKRRGKRRKKRLLDILPIRVKIHILPQVC